MIVLPIHSDIVKYVVSEYLWTHNWSYNAELKRLCEIVEGLNTPTKINLPLPLNVIMYVISDYLNLWDLMYLNEYIKDLHINGNKIKTDEKCETLGPGGAYTTIDTYYNSIVQKRTRYRNGILEFEGYYMDNKNNGLSRFWHSNGNISNEKFWNNYKPYGVWKKFDENGKLTEIIDRDEYPYSLLDKNGNIIGTKYY